MTLPETILKHEHTYYQCKNRCGNYVRIKGGLCKVCYIKLRKENASKEKKQYLYPCINNCGDFVRSSNRRCIACYKKELANKADAKNQHDSKHRTIYKCKNCGATASHKNTLCRSCYSKLSSRTTGISIRDKDYRKRYPCKSCGTPIFRPTGLCRDCYNKKLHEQSELRQKEVYVRQEANAKRLHKKDGTNGLVVCPKNPDGGSHIEIINDNKIGICKFCGRKKDYAKLQADYPW